MGSFDKERYTLIVRQVKVYTWHLNLYLTSGEIQSQIIVDVASGMCGDEMEKDRRNNPWRQRGGYQVTREEIWSASCHES